MTELECIESILLTRGQSVVFRARGTSMYPTIFSDDWVLLEPLPHSKRPRDNEIILTRNHGRYQLHRYYEINGQTKGDNLSEWDLPHAIVLARVVKVKKTWRSRLKRFVYRLQQLQKKYFD